MAIRIESHDPPRRMLDLTHQQFYNLVDQDVRNRLDDDIAGKFRDDDVVERWFQVLVQMKKNVESQLASAKEDWRSELFQILADMEEAPTDERASDLRAEQYAKQAEYCGKRAKKLRFRSAVEDNLAEARYLRNTLIEKRASTMLAAEKLRVHELEAAIELHKSTTDGRGDSSDLELWASVG